MFKYNVLSSLIGGSPCFTSDALVLTLNGYVNIDKIKVGDIVLTHTGNWKKVLHIGSKISKITKLMLNTGMVIETTDNHPFYIKKELENEPEWLEVKELDINYYNAFCVQQDSVNNSFKNILSKSIQEQKTFLHDYIKILNYNTFLNVPFDSLSNALTLQQLILNCYSSYSPITIINEIYLVKINTEINNEYSHNCVWSNILAEVNKTEEENIVYNIEVEDDNSYTVNNIVVHNCQSFSPLGKQEGFEGKSGLFYEYLRIYTTKQDRNPNSGLIEYKDGCRFLTREELEQAQNLPIGYTKSLSYNQACVVLGNGWTIKIVSHIFREILSNTVLSQSIKGF